MVGLGGVVEHHVEDDLDAGAVECVDHGAELATAPGSATA